MAYQGELDGLCGPYAVVNAFDLCGLNEDWLGQDLFIIACLALNNWPKVLWKGTTFPQMKKMLKACRKELARAYRKAGYDFHVRVEYPFAGNQEPRSNREYRERFDGIFSYPDVMCGILGMDEPHEHWLAFVNRRKSLTVFDSSAEGAIRRIAKRDIYAGRCKRRRYLVDREELVVFRNIGPA